MTAEYFSEHFGVERHDEDDWFDPILGTDTKLFADPFLVFKDIAPEWVGAHDELMVYFSIVFHMVGNTMSQPDAPERIKALELLRFPEPRYFCLGYTDEGTAGAGGGKKYARLICEGMEQAIHRGLNELAHFEALGILNKGIGRDRISDLLCNVLIERMIRYTSTVVTRHDLQTETHRIDRGQFGIEQLRWNPVEVRLPTNPSNGQPLLLIPSRFLRALPTLNAGDFWESSEASQLRADLNWDINRTVDKRAIVELARRSPEAVDRWTRSKEQAQPTPYDFDSDPVGVYNWLRQTRAYAMTCALDMPSAPRTKASFIEVVDALVGDYKHFVEQRGGWKLLVNDDGSEKAEEAAQLLFRGVAEARCAAHDIVIDREVELGRGTVDFKFSSGYSNRALLEVKKLHNGKFWNGLESQLTTYLTADRCRTGRFMVIQYRTHNRRSDVGRRAENLQGRTADLARRFRMDLNSTLVDARRPPSASTL